jgi:arabinan endo-1,5-alpha-L-arabinosidase
MAMPASEANPSSGTIGAIMRIHRFFLVLMLGGVSMGQTAPTTQDAQQQLAAMGKRDIWTHDPSTIVKSGDEYWVYSTGFGIRSMHSKDLVNWRQGPAVLPDRPKWTSDLFPASSGRQGFWAPDVIHLGDRYLIYYAVSSFGKKVSAIGLATNTTLDPNDPKYAWKDQGPVMQSGQKDDFNAIDPGVTFDAHDGLWLCFGSFWSGIKLIQLDPATGMRIKPDSKIYSLAHAKEIEAPCIYKHGDYYYLFVNWGLCCRGVNSTYNIRMGRSEKITGPYLDKEGKDMLHEGGTLLAGSEGAFIGPGHAGILEEKGKFWMSMHFYDATQWGRSALAIREVSWGDDGWPRLSG